MRHGEVNALNLQEKSAWNDSKVIIDKRIAEQNLDIGKAGMVLAPRSLFRSLCQGQDRGIQIPRNPDAGEPISMGK
jgi:hypothetical protein